MLYTNYDYHPRWLVTVSIKKFEEIQILPGIKKFCVYPSDLCILKSYFVIVTVTTAFLL